MWDEKKMHFLWFLGEKSFKKQNENEKKTNLMVNWNLTKILILFY